MENSFFEYRDETGVDSDSESEFIDNSLIDESIGPKKTPGKKNQTAFIPESEDSLTEGYLLIKFYFIQSTTSNFILRLNHYFYITDDTEEESTSTRARKSISRRSNVKALSNHIVLSSDDGK